MTRARWTLLIELCLALLIGGSKSAQAQYMFLDTNGDGINSPADAIGGAGENNVDIWLITDRTRASVAVQCSVGQDELSINSFEVILEAIEGSINWGEVTPRREEFTISLGVARNARQIHFGFFSLAILPPGKYLLATVSLMVSSGEPSLRFAPTSTLSGAFLTGFGSRCTGRDADNTLKLGLDWFDTDGVDFGAGGVDGTDAPVNATAGTVYLGGNRLDPPFELRFHHGALTVNGLQVPPRAPQRRVVSETRYQQAQIVSDLNALVSALHSAGLADSVMADSLAIYCRARSGVKDVKVVRNERIALRFTDGVVINYVIHKPTDTARPSLRTQRRRELLELKSLLDDGGMLLYATSEIRTLVPSSRNEEVRPYIANAIEGRVRSSGEPQYLPDEVREQLARPAALLRVDTR